LSCYLTPKQAEEKRIEDKGVRRTKKAEEQERE